MQDHIVFDRHAVRLHRDRAAHTVQMVQEILQSAGVRLLDRLDDVTRQFTQALDVGGRGVIAPALRARGVSTVSCDLSSAMLSLSGSPGVVADEEWLPFGAGSFDLIVASLSLHWINDLPGALLQLRHALKPDGLFLASVPVLPTLTELRETLLQAELELTGGASPRVSPFPQLGDCAALLQRAGFAMPVVDGDALSLGYNTPLALLRDLRHAGESNALMRRDRRVPPRGLFPAALSGLTGSLPHEPTLRLAILTGWGPVPPR